MAISATTICNQALSRIGDKRLVSYGGSDSEEARLCLQFYDQSVKEVLEAANIRWHVAQARTGPLAAVANQPSFGYDYAYSLPSDCLAVIDLVTDDADTSISLPWKREGNYILTDEDTVYLVYVQLPSTPGIFSAKLIRAIVTRLASYLATPLVSPQLGLELTREYYEIALTEAISANQANVYVEDESGEWTWTTKGRS